MTQDNPFAGKTLAELQELRERGRRRLNAVVMGNLADMRVAAHYEPYAPDSFDLLDRQAAHERQLRQALAALDTAIANATPA